MYACSFVHKMFVHSKYNIVTWFRSQFYILVGFLYKGKRVVNKKTILVFPLFKACVQYMKLFKAKNNYVQTAEYKTHKKCKERSNIWIFSIKTATIWNYEVLG